jgi:8-oxo-dGTP pyrophosphatase MutT (NUDIX family)
MWRVSVKGVVLRRGRVLLLRNERHEWELPGGSLERDETPQECVVREIREESGWSVACGQLLDTWIYRISPTVGEVLIITYACRLLDLNAAPVLSQEHNEIGLFCPGEIDDLPIPDGYRASIRTMEAVERTIR